MVQESNMKCIRCGLCCYLHREFRKDRRVFSDPCEHLTFVFEIPTCAIYENRPQQCKDYFCRDYPEPIGGSRVHEA